MCHGGDLEENCDYLKEVEPLGVKHESVELIGMRKTYNGDAVLVKINSSEGSEYMVYWVKRINGSLKIVDWADLWDTNL